MEHTTPEVYRTAELNELVATLRHQAEQPLGGDVRSAAFAKTLAYLLDGESFADELQYRPDIHSCQDNAPVAETIADIIHMRSKIKNEPFVPSALSGLTLRAIQAAALANESQVGPHRYPHDFTEPTAWYDALEWILTDHQRADDFTLIMYNLDLLSNVPQRGAALKLGAQVLQSAGLLRSRPVVYVPGCSQQGIEKKLASGEAFMPVEGMRIGESGELEPSGAFTTTINALLMRRWAASSYIGFDIRDPREPFIRNFARACRFYPSELLDETRVQEANRLDGFDSPNILFAHSDFTEFTPPNNENLLPQPDIVFFSFVLYQQSAAKQQHMITKAAELLNPNGWIFILDFVKPDPSQPTGMKFETDWTATQYLCRLLAISKNDKTLTPHELFIFENGRIERVQLGMAITALGSTKRREIKINYKAA